MADVPDLTAPLVRVTLAHGEVYDVQTANPDLVRFDMTRGRMHWADAREIPFLWMTFVAWSAMKREHLIPDDMTWETFSESECLGIEPLNVEPTQVGPADPTQPAPEPV